MESLIHSLLARSTGNNLALQLSSEVEVGEGLAVLENLRHVGSDTIFRSINSIRIEDTQLVVWGKKPTHT